MNAPKATLHIDATNPNVLWFGSDYANDSVILRKHSDGVVEVTYYPHNDPQGRRLHLFAWLTDLREWAEEPFWHDPSRASAVSSEEGQ